VISPPTRGQVMPKCLNVEVALLAVAYPSSVLILKRLEAAQHICHITEAARRMFVAPSFRRVLVVTAATREDFGHRKDVRYAKEKHVEQEGMGVRSKRPRQESGTLHSKCRGSLHSGTESRKAEGHCCPFHTIPTPRYVPSSLKASSYKSRYMCN
jgi:hypothetical protein